MDVVKQRLQLGYYRGIRHCVSSMLREEGALAFFSDQMAAGVLLYNGSRPDELTWRLFLAPGGQVLDTVTVRSPKAAAAAGP
jgi:hypothetical protein